MSTRKTSIIALLVLCTAAAASDRRGQGLVALSGTARASISAALGADIADYHITATNTGLFARNPQQNMAVSFTPAGINVRTGHAAWEMALRGYGRGNRIAPAQSVVPQLTVNRVQYRRGTLTEWYVNGPVGLEQGFTVGEPPSLTNGEPLTISLAVSGGLDPVVAKDGKSARTISGGATLEYSGLMSRDAGGKELAAWLEVQGNQLLVKVDDRGARYPIVIDPWMQLAELTTYDGVANDFFGSATDISGNTVVVGSPNATIGSNPGQGATYVFVEPTGGWQSTSSFTAKLTASDGLAGDAFGSAASISKNTIAVGACSQSAVCSNGPGKAYVFVKPTGGWTTTSTFNAELTASDGTANDAFGNSITVAGSTVVVGAPGATIGSNVGQGADYVFVKPRNGWQNMTETAKLTASDGKAGDGLGFVSLNSAGSIALLGAPFAAVGSNAQQGTAYMFVKPTNGWKTTSKFKAKLTASDGQASDFFGFCNFGGRCLSADGKTLIVAAPQGDSAGSTGPGKAYIFLEPSKGWKTTSHFTAKLTASDGVTGDNFGFSASISETGALAVIGAEFANTSQGAAYVYGKPKSGWKTTSKFTAKLTASDGRPYSFFSYGGAAVSGNTVAVGAAGTKVGTNKDQGAAYVFGP